MQYLRILCAPFRRFFCEACFSVVLFKIIFNCVINQGEKNQNKATVKKQVSHFASSLLLGALFPLFECCFVFCFLNFYAFLTSRNVSLVQTVLPVPGIWCIYYFATQSLVVNCCCLPKQFPKVSANINTQYCIKHNIWQLLHCWRRGNRQRSFKWRTTCL